MIQPTLVHHLDAVNAAVVAGAVLLGVPLPAKRGPDVSWTAYSGFAAAAFLVACGAVWVGDRSVGQGDEHGTAVYLLCAGVALLLALAVRLPFTRGVDERWAAVPLTGAVACGVAAIAALA